MVNTKMVFYHPKKYKELHGLTSRKCNTRQRAPGSLPANGASNSDQAISHANSTRGPSDVRPDPGQTKKATSSKSQATSNKHKSQATSSKQQANEG